MDNILLVSKTLPFPQLMRIAEGMSYKHDSVVIKARGKQIQRAVEVAIMLQERGRGSINETTYGAEGDDIHIPSIQINITV